MKGGGQRRTQRSFVEPDQSNKQANNSPGRLQQKSKKLDPEMAQKLNNPSISRRNVRSKGTPKAEAHGSVAMGPRSVSSVSGKSMRSAQVTTMYNQKQRFKSCTNINIEQIKVDVKKLATISETHEKLNDHHKALENHVELQELITSTFQSAKLQAKDETLLRFALADSSFRMSIIYEDNVGDLVQAAQQYKKTLRHFQDIRRTMDVSGFYIQPKVALKEGIPKDLIQLNRDLVVKVCNVLIKLSENYTKQEKWQFAQQVCLDALDVIGFGVNNKTNVGRKDAPEDLKELRDHIARNLLKIHQTQGMTARSPESKVFPVAESRDETFASSSVSYDQTNNGKSAYDSSRDSEDSSSYDNEDKARSRKSGGLTWLERAINAVTCTQKGDGGLCSSSTSFSEYSYVSRRKRYK